MNSEELQCLSPFVLHSGKQKRIESVAQADQGQCEGLPVIFPSKPNSNKTSIPKLIIHQLRYSEGRSLVKRLKRRRMEVTFDSDDNPNILDTKKLTGINIVQRSLGTIAQKSACDPEKVSEMNVLHHERKVAELEALQQAIDMVCISWPTLPFSREKQCGTYWSSKEFFLGPSRATFINGSADSRAFFALVSEFRPLYSKSRLCQEYKLYVEPIQKVFIFENKDQFVVVAVFKRSTLAVWLFKRQQMESISIKRVSREFVIKQIGKRHLMFRNVPDCWVEMYYEGMQAVEMQNLHNQRLPVELCWVGIRPDEVVIPIVLPIDFQGLEFPMQANAAYFLNLLTIYLPIFFDCPDAHPTAPKIYPKIYEPFPLNRIPVQMSTPEWIRFVLMKMWYDYGQKEHTTFLFDVLDKGMHIEVSPYEFTSDSITIRAFQEGKQIDPICHIAFPHPSHVDDPSTLMFWVADSFIRMYVM